MWYLANAVDEGTFRSPVVTVSGGEPPAGMDASLPDLSGAFGHFAAAKKFIVRRDVLQASAALAASDSGGVACEGGFLATGLQFVDGPVWLEYDTPPDYLADELPFKLASTRIGCLIVPENGRGVQFFAIVSPLPGQVMALPVILRCDRNGRPTFGAGDNIGAPV